MSSLEPTHNNNAAQNPGVDTKMEQTETSTNNGMFLGVGLSIFLITAAFFSGFHVGSGDHQGASLGTLFAGNAEAPVEDVDMGEFWRVWHTLDERFVSGTTTDALSNEEKMQGAIAGLVASYRDPYTIYMPPAAAASFEEDISGNFSGVGMEIGMRDGIITVISPLPDTPAEKAGLLSGDRIVKIDDTPSDTLTVDQAVDLIRGEVGTNVVLTIYRDGDSEFREITVTRDVIDIPTIKTQQEGDVFIISLYSFNALAEMKMQEALRAYVESGATKLVLDLRGNPGGFLQSAVSIASYFLPVGKVVVVESFGAEATDEDVVYRSSGKTLRNFAPENIVVLVNQGSASASEILAGALKAHNVATIVGETTFGKGSVQELVNLPSGASLKVTIARWLTPDGTSISEGGLEPNITVERTPDMILADEDPQLEAAIAILHGTYVPPTATSTADALLPVE